MCARQPVKQLAVIGGGSAGTQAALYAASQGLQVTLYEAGALGGVCLNSGCMPTKALLHAVGQLPAPDASLWPKLTGQIETKISMLRRGVQQQLRRAGVQVQTESVPLDRLPETDAVILAVGRVRADIPQVAGKEIYRHDTILSMPQLPDRMAILGGGVSGLEYAQIFARLGCQVTVYEQKSRILPSFPEQFAQRLMELCQAEGVEFVCGQAMEMESLPEPVVLLAAGPGRMPEEMVQALRRSGIRADCDGIWTDAEWQTSVPQIYAAGDCTSRTATAFEATRAARCAVDALLGRQVSAPGVMPQVVCGWQDLVCLGRSEGLRVCCDLGHNGYAFLRDRMDGMVQLVCDETSGVLTGAQLLFPGAAEVGSMLAAAMDSGIAVETLAGSLCFHPSFSETIVQTAVQLYERYREQKHQSL